VTDTLEERAGSLEAAIREAVDAAKTKEGKATEAVPLLAAERTELEQLRAEKDKAAAKAEIDAIVKEAVKAALLDVRSPSIAGQVGNPALADSARKRIAENITPALKAWVPDDYVAGTMLTAIANMGSMQGDKAAGKAVLDALGLAYLAVPEDTAKATLGTTGATGGYVLPNNLVAQLEKPNTQVAVYTGSNPLVTVIPGVAVRGIDQPYRTGAPSRMTAQDWGATKENVDEAYGSYTATLTTFARIYDIGKQYARFSAGAAEADVIDELTKAAALTENFAVIAGPGTGSATPGVNDATKGVYTSILGNVFTTAHSASASTVAGSAAAGLAAAFSSLSERSRYPTAVVVDNVTYWTMFSQGSDSAGFWMSELLGAGFSIGADNALRWRGVPIYYDANLTANSAAKIAIVGDWKSLKFYRGQEFRIDSTDVAGDRWDKNLIGFRGEMEIAVNADTAVAVGAFQLVTGLIP
jgi:HK97 family phage major capsid protein